MNKELIALDADMHYELEDYLKEQWFALSLVQVNDDELILYLLKQLI